MTDPALSKSLKRERVPCGRIVEVAGERGDCLNWVFHGLPCGQTCAGKISVCQQAARVMALEARVEDVQDVERLLNAVETVARAFGVRVAEERGASLGGGSPPE